MPPLSFSCLTQLLVRAPPFQRISYNSVITKFWAWGPPVHDTCEVSQWKEAKAATSGTNHLVMRLKAWIKRLSMSSFLKYSNNPKLMLRNDALPACWLKYIKQIVYLLKENMSLYVSQSFLNYPLNNSPMCPNQKTANHEVNHILFWAIPVDENLFQKQI